MMLRTMSILALLAAYAACLIPLTTYVNTFELIHGLIVINLLAYISVLLVTVDITQGILTSSKHKAPTPAWLKTPKLQTWWVVARRSLKWQLALVIPKLGLALGLVQIFHLKTIGWTSQIMDFRPYNYTSLISSVELAYPQWQTVLIALAVLIVFGLAENFFLVALAMWVKTPKLGVLAIRLLLGLASIFVIWLIPSVRITSDIGYVYQIRANRVQETVDVAVMSLNHQGTMLATNIMRPVGENTVFTRIWDCEDAAICFDNRPFVLRQLVGVLLGLAFYVGFTFWVLRLVAPEPEQVATEG